jgi:rod shape-determining protein MreB
VRPQLAIDLGTVNTLVLAVGRGLVVDEPSAIAYDCRTGRPLAVGRAAEELAGTEPAGVEVVHPLADGVIGDLDAATDLLTTFVGRACRRPGSIRLDAAVCIPSGATSVERKALIAAVDGVGRSHRTTVVAEPLAAALGAAGEAAPCAPRVVVDIGGGTTEIAAVTSGAVLAAVRTRSIRVAGNEMDLAVVDAVKRALGLVVSRRAGERLKMAMGLDSPEQPVTGIDQTTSAIRSALVPPQLMREALRPTLDKIVDAVQELMCDLPPEVAEGVLRGGVVLTGGGALLRGLPALLGQRVGVPVRAADDPLRCVVRGLALVLGEHVGDRSAA